MKKNSLPQNERRNAERPQGLPSFDYSNLMASAIGEAGLEDKDLKRIETALTAAAKQIRGQYEKGQLPFMDLPFASAEAAACKKMAEDLRRFDTVMVLGIGGSALGAKAVFTALKPLNHNSLPKNKRQWPRLVVADNVDPEGFCTLLEELDIRQTVFNVISKSGSTAETMSQFLIIYERLKRELGKSSLKEHLIITTDPQQGVLRELVQQQQLRSLSVPVGVGGRFSVMTAVGLAPLAACGVDIDEFLAGAAACLSEPSEPVMQNMAYLFAGLNWYLCTKKKRSSLVLMPYADSLNQVADWFGQLWNESLGKAKLLNGQSRHCGQTAIKAVGATDQHSQLQLYMEGPQDKNICFIRCEAFRQNLAIPKLFEDQPSLAYLGGSSLGELINHEHSGTAMALALSGRPNMTISLPQVTPAALGYLMQMLELATVVSGALYKINPLDQPGVELGKKFTYGLMGREGFKDFKKKYDQALKKAGRYKL